MICRILSSWLGDFNRQARNVIRVGCHGDNSIFLVETEHGAARQQMVEE